MGKRTRLYANTPVPTVSVYSCVLLYWSLYNWTSILLPNNLISINLKYVLGNIWCQKITKFGSGRVSALSLLKGAARGVIFFEQE